MPIYAYNPVKGYTEHICDNCGTIVPWSSIDMFGWCRKCQARNPVYWKKDHWSLFAYIGSRCVDYNGVLDYKHLRLDGNKYPTRISTGEVLGHNDLDCIEDLEYEGLIINRGTGLNPKIEITDKGWKILIKLQQHKAKGGNYNNFYFS